jgi:flagellin
MSGIVLSASVRQNLLSLQSTAALLATTQNNLATGNKVNSALDNPTEFFTAAGLTNRAADIGNLLDGIGNGVQVLQAANTGITSLQSLVANAQSIANQVLQTSTGYSTKSSVTTAVIPGATAQNLLGTSGTNVSNTSSAVINNQNGAAITTATLLSGGASTDSISGTAITPGGTLVVDGTTFTFIAGSSSSGTNIGVGDTVGDLLSKIDAITGATGANASTITGGKINLSTGTTSNLTISSTPTGILTALNLTAGTTNIGLPALSNKTLTIPAIATGTTATNITFGTGAGQISTLNGLNAALAANDLQATISTTGAITIETTNNAASSTIGTLSGSAAVSGQAFYGTSAALSGQPPVADPNSQLTRNSLVAQYNQVLKQIDTTAQDSSFNGINLLSGDTLNLTFDETGASKLAITGVNFNDAGLGLSTLTAGTDFIDSNSANAVLTQLTNASTTLRTAASSLGSNLSVVEIRQDFNKNLINVLQTGASNLTVADPNQEAANSQALSTRQSIAVSALALANQSQQSVLQLLR